ncbi:MAG TPA: class I SAM-dependent methyltransferase [Thermoanaerobaculia bacterium]|jgi:demethylmenaquinone methyltransferase/2-methoxy-6-polyprenyl-1,4-benzoquinol methylase|nr:class I SAM-dependent methyltransferase [Thermoanaerobaculia bacterium]
MTDSPAEAEPLAAHPPLPSYYRADAERQSFLNRLFDRASTHYDWVNAVMSFGSGYRYRDEVLRRTQLREGMRVLDVACGTGPVAFAAKRIVGPGGRVVGVDPSRGMLNVAKEKVDARFVEALGEALAIRGESFDLLTMGYALRHVSDLRAAFREYHRVLKPGGRVVIMEIAVPQSAFRKRLLGWYMGRVIPLVVRLGTRSRDAEQMMRYYWDTTANCVPPATIMQALRDAGFRDVRRDVQWGMLCEYHGVR